MERSGFWYRVRPAALILAITAMLSFISIGARSGYHQDVPPIGNFILIFAVQNVYWLIWTGIAFIGLRALEMPDDQYWSSWRRLALRLAGVALAAIAVLSLFYWLAAPILTHGPATRLNATRQLYWEVITNTGLFLTVLFAASAVQARRDRQARAVAEQRAQYENQRLESALSAAQLDALRAQIHPHLIFNALNSVGALIEIGDSTAAYDANLKLAQLFRRTFAAMDCKTISLADEFALVTEMFSIGAIRYGDRFSWSVDLPDALAEVKLPPFLVQPLAENALVHAVGGSSHAVHIAVSAAVTGATIVLKVTDTGPGMGKLIDGPGLGLRNLAERVALLGGSLTGHTAGGSAKTGHEAVIELSFQCSP